MKPITILLADDHALVREGLRSLLQAYDDFKIVGEAENGRKAITLANELLPDIIIMDISMPMLNGLEATRQILQAHPTIKVLALSAHSEDVYVERMIAAGASGYVLKQNSGQLVVNALKEIANGNSFFSPSLSKRLENPECKTARENSDFPEKNRRPLTARETEVLQLVAESAANKQVAAELGISVKTVEKHRQQIMHKLDIHDTAGLTRHAIATGIIEIDLQPMMA